MKCKTCKDKKYCENWCFGFNYEPSLYQLIKEKLKNSIIKLLRL